MEDITLKVEKIGKIKENTIILDDINFNLSRGEILSILGPKSSGKSMLLSIIYGIEIQTKGKILLDNIPIDGITTDIRSLKSKDCLLTWKSVLDNLIFELKIKGMDTDINREYVNSLISKYDLEEYVDLKPTQIPVTIRKKVALMKLIIFKPKVILLDEAFLELDKRNKNQIIDEYVKILKQEKIATIVITNDISEAIQLSDKIAVLTNKPTSIKRIYDIEFEIDKKTTKKIIDEHKFTEYYNILWKDALDNMKVSMK